MVTITAGSKKPWTTRRVLSSCGEAALVVVAAPVVLCCLGVYLLGGGGFYCGTGRLKMARQKAERKRAEKLWGNAKWEFKMPTPPRRRAVTISSTTELQPWQKTLDQAQSPFFTKLPLEIRRLIYAHTLGGGSVHLSTPNTELHATGCPSKTCRCRLFQGKGDLPLNFGLSLLTTCRKVYSEAIESLYSENTFAFTTGALGYGNRISSTIELLPILFLPQRLRQVRSLFFDCDFEFFVSAWLTPCWHQTCKALSTFTGLHRLHIVINSPGEFSLWKQRGEWMTEDLLQITAPKEFVVTLPFDDDPIPYVPPESRLRFELPGPKADRLRWIEEDLVAETYMHG